MSSGNARIPTDAWHAEADSVDESRWTPGGEGWSAWNGASPEREFCDFAAALVALNRPSLVIETGVGQGYMTRRILGELPGRYIGYESDDDLRLELAGLPFWNGGAELSEAPTPSEEQFSECDFAILDSAALWRAREFDGWRAHSPAGSFVLVHDARPDHPIEDGVWRRVAEYVGSGGVFLGNPRGAWLYRKPVHVTPA